MTKDIRIAAVALALTLPLAAYAAEMDKDGDGAVTMDEFSEAMPDAAGGTFSAADTDADGVLSEAEIAAAIDAGILPEG